MDGTLDWTDADNDQEWDVGEGEEWTISGATGGYTFTTNVDDQVLVAFDGIDTSTGENFDGILTALPGDKVITPLTTIAASIVKSNIDGIVGRQPTEEEIETKLAELRTAEPIRLLREERDRRIAETDWWVLPDRTASQEQKDYRQALRDITETQTPTLDENGQLTNVTWPTKPT